MKEELLIERFEGVYGAADPRDLPPGVASYAENLDAASEVGLFRGLPADRTVTLAGNVAMVGGGPFTLFDDGDKVAYYAAGAPGTVRVLTNLSATQPQMNSFSRSGVPGQGSSDGRSVRLGLGRNYAPAWVGTISGALTVTDASLSSAHPQATVPSSVIEVEPTATDNNQFTAQQIYQYGYSLIHDGFQEGPLVYLNPVPATAPSDRGFYQQTISPKSVTVRVRFYKPPPELGADPELEPWSRSPRITAIAFYRRTWIGGLSGIPSAFTLVGTVNMTSDDVFELLDTGNIGPSYEQRTGMPETLSSFDVNYRLSCSAGGFHVVGDCRKDQVGEAAKTMLFRSKPFRFDTFDWTQDYLTLPTTPTALCSFAGRIFAFSEARTYVVSPDLTLEDTWEGVGCSGPQSFVVTDAGLFFCNKASIYYYDGRQVNHIGQPVQTNQIVPDVGWSTASHTNAPVALYDGKRNMALFVFNRSEHFIGAWAYHVETQRWTLLAFSAAGVGGALRGGFSDKDGRPFLSVGTKLYELLGHATQRRAWSFRSQIMNQSNHPQTYYKARLVGTANIFFFFEDGGAISQPLTADSYQEVTINTSPTPPWQTTHSFAFEVMGEADHTLRSISIIRRRRNPR
jgi:hypothetical protein